MNLLHLKYLIEVEKYGSISQAAKSLYMNQPQLSKIVKELESNLNIKIFERNSKGVVVTKKGKEFIVKAKRIVNDIDEFESEYKKQDIQSYNLDVCVPRASYISQAFVSFLDEKQISNHRVHINYQETNSIDTIRNIYDGVHDIGIIRLPIEDKDIYYNILTSKDLHYEELYTFTLNLLMSKDNPLYEKDIQMMDLHDQIELLHGDISLPGLPLSATSSFNDSIASSKVINIYERASQFEILMRIKHSYMWVSPMPQSVLERFNLVQKKCDDIDIEYIDLLIYRKGYVMSEKEVEFINILKQVIAKINRI